MSCIECLIGEGPTIAIGLLLMGLILLVVYLGASYLWRLLTHECTFYATVEGPDDPLLSSEHSPEERKL